jgi:hypothetical protein
VPATTTHATAVPRALRPVVEVLERGGRWATAVAAALAALLIALAALVATSGRVSRLRAAPVLRPLAAVRPEVALGLLAGAGGLAVGVLLLRILAI